MPQQDFKEGIEYIVYVILILHSTCLSTFIFTTNDLSEVDDNYHKLLLYYYNPALIFFFAVVLY